MIHVILLSGGSGSRLWPLSNSARSKQFLKVLRDGHGQPCSMVQRVFSQIRRVNPEIRITIASCANQENSIRAQLDGDYELVLEPERRDTAPAIMLSCAHLRFAQHANDDDTVIVMPIDTFADQSYYDHITELDVAVQSNEFDLVLLGVKPTYPSEKYGYIIPSEQNGSPQRVASFREKPSIPVAESFIEKGGLWNCGVFAFKLGYLINLIDEYIDIDTNGFDDIRTRYSELPKNSFDYEVVEKAESIAVIPHSGIWKDLGTWNTLCEEMVDASHGHVVTTDITNTHVINETGLPMIVAGLENAVIVATHDGILACNKNSSASLKQYVEQISESRPMYEKRFWGEYRVIDLQTYDNERSTLTKELVIASSKQLSYQRHAHRHEIWTIVRGEGYVVIDGNVTPVTTGSVINIYPMQMHAVKAIEDLHIIEVQLGNPLIEEDIERFGYYWDE